MKLKDTLSEYRVRYEPTRCTVFADCKPITSSRDAADACLLVYSLDGMNTQVSVSCYALMLNKVKKPIGFVKLSQGGTKDIDIDIKLLTKAALDTMASGVILVHNHPSGETEPSDEDDDATRKVRKAFDLFDIDLIDHIVLGSKDYFSYAEDGKKKYNPKRKKTA